MCSPHPVHVIEVPIMSSKRFRMHNYHSMAFTSRFEANGAVAEVPYDASPQVLVSKLLPLLDSEPRWGRGIRRNGLTATAEH